MSSFESSTQCLHWKVSVEVQRKWEYLLLRKKNDFIRHDDTGNRRLRTYLRYLKAHEHNATMEVFSLSTLQGSVTDEAAAAAAEDTLDVAVRQGEVVLQYFCELLRRDCGPGPDCAVKTTWRVPNTAVVYFRRFYLHNSLFAHDPRVLMVASLLLAGKAEEEFVAPALLTTHVHPSLGDAQLQAAEESLLQGLDYELQVYHPHSCVRALLSDAKARFLTRGGSQSEQVQVQEWAQQWAKQAERLADKLLNCEAGLAGVPVTLAVAALLRTEPAPPQEGFSLLALLQAALGESTSQDLLAEVALLGPYLDQEERPPDQVKASLKLLNSRAAWSLRGKKDKKDKKDKRAAGSSGGS